MKAGFLPASLFDFGKTAFAMSAPLRLPTLLGQKHVVASAVRDMQERLHVKKHIGRGSFGEGFLRNFELQKRSRQKNKLIIAGFDVSGFK